MIEGFKAKFVEEATPSLLRFMIIRPSRRVTWSKS